MIEGLTQALHLSEKQLTIPAKIHTEKKMKYFFDGAEGKVWKPSALLPSSDGFQRLCLWPSPRCHGTCLYAKPPAAGSARKCPSRARPEDRPAIFNSKWTFSCYYLVFGLLQPINRNYAIHYIYLFPELMERAQAAGQHPSPAEPFQLLAMDSTGSSLARGCIWTIMFISCPQSVSYEFIKFLFEPICTSDLHNVLIHCLGQSAIWSFYWLPLISHDLCYKKQ